MTVTGKLVPQGDQVDAATADDLIRGVLDAERLLSLATVDPSTLRPHVNTCYFASLDGWRLVVLTAPSSQHGRFIGNGAPCAVNVFSSTYQVGDPIAGLQLAGGVRQCLGNAEESAAHAAYVMRHPQFGSYAPTLADIHSKFESRFYIIEITSGKLIDERSMGPEQYLSFLVDRSE